MTLENTIYKSNGLKLEQISNNAVSVTYNGKNHNAIATDINEKNWIIKDLAYQLNMSMKKVKENFKDIEKFITLIEISKEL